MKSLFSQIISVSLGLWLSALIVPGVWMGLYSDSNFFGFYLTSFIQLYLILGICLGLLNFFIKPVIGFITFPLAVVTLGLFGFAINMAFVYVIDLFFKEFSSPIFWPLFWTTVIIWILNKIIEGFILKNNDNY